MADFKTHAVTATVVSAGLATAAAAAGLATAAEAILYGLAGVLGGILPDIDSDESVALRLVFNCLGVMVAALVALLWVSTLPAWQVLGLSALSYLLVRYPVAMIFARFTVHRGILHSLLANVLFASLSVALAYHYFQLSAQRAWGIGGFVFIGAGVHLLLDELYSVDLSGMRIKRSFGSALKITQWRSPGLTLLMSLAVAGTLWLSPGPGAWQQAWPQLTGLPWPTWPEIDGASLLDWMQRGLALLNASGSIWN